MAYLGQNCVQICHKKSSKYSNIGRARAHALFYTLGMDKKRARQLIKYIDSKLDYSIDGQGKNAADLSLESISGHFGYSPFHFHRQTRTDIGIGLYRYIQLMRLKRAAFRLAFRGQGSRGAQPGSSSNSNAKLESLTDIALASGYESLEAFNRAFKQRLGQSPAEFRKSPAWQTFHRTFQEMRTLRRNILSSDYRDLYKETDVLVLQVPQTPVAVMRHHGDPAMLGETIRKFIAWRKTHHLSPDKSATYNFFYGGPDDTAPEDFRLDLACSIETLKKNSDGPLEDDGEIQYRNIPAGLCAFIKIVGSDDLLDGAANFLYRVWLEENKNKYTLRDFPLYARRLVFFPEVAENEAVTELYLPLEAI